MPTEPQNDFEMNEGLQVRPNVAMFHSGRTGSTVLGDLLKQHPNVDWAGEIYEKRKSVHRKMGKEAVSGNPIQIVSEHMSNSQIDKVFGFDVQFYSLREFSVEITTSVDTRPRRRLDLCGNVRTGC